MKSWRRIFSAQKSGRAYQFKSKFTPPRMGRWLVCLINPTSKVSMFCYAKKSAFSVTTTQLFHRFQKSAMWSEMMQITCKIQTIWIRKVSILALCRLLAWRPICRTSFCVLLLEWMESHAQRCFFNNSSTTRWRQKSNELLK